MQFSEFGRRFSVPSGITLLMDDLGRAMAGCDDMLMLGGGNPAHIPEVQAIWRQRMESLLADGNAFDRMLANYDTPKGAIDFIESLAAFLRRHFGWEVTPEHIAVMNGGQSALFCLLNMLSGTDAKGRKRKVLFPLMPEYIGYADQSLEPDSFRALRPRIEEIGTREFKYHVDFDRLEIGDDIGAMCVSRPTNPTGNVLTDEEVRSLSALAREKNIPLIVDNAYGNPFPGIIFTEATPLWDENSILTFSLSKLGLPGTRTGIVIAPPEVIQGLVSMNSVLSLASGTIGQRLVEPLLAGDELCRITDEMIRPFYRARSVQAQAWIREYLPEQIDYRYHKSEGSIFLWLWFRDLPITSRELYERLKQRGVLVVPGEFFFFGLEQPWEHQHECLRMTYSQESDAVHQGIRIMADTLREIYA